MKGLSALAGDHDEQARDKQKSGIESESTAGWG